MTYGLVYVYKKGNQEHRKPQESFLVGKLDALLYCGLSIAVNAWPGGQGQGPEPRPVTQGAGMQSGNMRCLAHGVHAKTSSGAV